MARKTTATTETARKPLDMELVNLDGKLALHFHTMTDWTSPLMRSVYYVSNLPVDGYLDTIVGQTVYGPNPGYGYVIRPGGSEVQVHYHDWECQTRTTPVEKPHDKAENTWEWDSGQWRVKWFPTCPECHKAHNPEWYDHCDWCGKGMSHGTRCPACKRNHSDD